jgi:DNA-binding GntR family transcriptional regulator
LKSLREQVYEFLRQELYTGTLVPGSCLNLNEISRQLRISRTPLRDALLQLETEGFVTIVPRSGVFVNNLTADAIRHCYEIVGALETSAILSNLDKINDSLIDKMKWLNEGLRKVIHRKDFDALYEMNLALHNTFMDLSDNTGLRRIVDAAKQRLYDFPRRGYIVEWELGNCDEHDQLIAAIEEHDRERIRSVWIDLHWDYPIQENFIRRFYLLKGLPEELDSAVRIDPKKKKSRPRAKPYFGRVSS